jgi:hypothetical protein
MQPPELAAVGMRNGGIVNCGEVGRGTSAGPTEIEKSYGQSKAGAIGVGVGVGVSGRAGLSQSPSSSACASGGGAAPSSQTTGQGSDPTRNSSFQVFWCDGVMV